MIRVRDARSTMTPQTPTEPVKSGRALDAAPTLTASALHELHRRPHLLERERSASMITLAPQRDYAPAFASFWMGGYEGADHVFKSGAPVSMCSITQHQDQAAADYARLIDFNIRTVRESVGWRMTERNGKFDFSSLDTRVCAARSHGLQIVWTLWHYGCPDDIDVFSAAFVNRFARFARATAQHLAQFCLGTPVYCPINEISFLSWALQSGRLPLKNATRHRRGDELTRQLVRAAIAACNAIWEVDPRARILHTDPLINVAVSAARTDLAAIALLQRERQFRAWDMLSGSIAPELGGHPRYLDLVGANYYCGSQWEVPTGRTLNWRVDDPRRVRLSALLDNLYRRYARPIVIAETGHVGMRRGAWISEVAEEARIAFQSGVALTGICIYPLIDRPDWENTARWYASGLWDLEMAGDGILQRRLNHYYAAALHQAQRLIGSATASIGAAPASLPRTDTARWVDPR